MESGKTLRNVLIESFSLHLDHHLSGIYIPFSPFPVLLAFLFWFWLGLLLTIACTPTTPLFQYTPRMALFSAYFALILLKAIGAFVLLFVQGHISD